MRALSSKQSWWSYHAPGCHYKIPSLENIYKQSLSHKVPMINQSWCPPKLTLWKQWVYCNYFPWVTLSNHTREVFTHNGWLLPHRHNSFPWTFPSLYALVLPKYHRDHMRLGQIAFKWLGAVAGYLGENLLTLPSPSFCDRMPIPSGPITIPFASKQSGFDE